MATVRINPPPDATTPPVAQVVDATNVAVETPTDTPRSVTLVAGAPPEATLTFSIESLPASGTLKDGGATSSSNGDPDPDGVSATVSSDGVNLYLQVRYKAGTFDSQLTRAQFIIDADRNPSTGHPGSDSGCVNDNGIIGAEFLVNLGADLGTTAEILQYNGTCNSFIPAGSGTTTFVTDGMNATVPLSVLSGATATSTSRW